MNNLNLTKLTKERNNEWKVLQKVFANYNRTNSRKPVLDAKDSQASSHNRVSCKSREPKKHTLEIDYRFREKGIYSKKENEHAEKNSHPITLELPKNVIPNFLLFRSLEILKEIQLFMKVTADLPTIKEVTRKIKDVEENISQDKITEAKNKIEILEDYWKKIAPKYISNENDDIVGSFLNYRLELRRVKSWLEEFSSPNMQEWLKNSTPEQLAADTRVREITDTSKLRDFAEQLLVPRDREQLLKTVFPEIIKNDEKLITNYVEFTRWKYKCDGDYQKYSISKDLEYGAHEASLFTTLGNLTPAVGLASPVIGFIPDWFQFKNGIHMLREAKNIKNKNTAKSINKQGWLQVARGLVNFVPDTMFLAFHVLRMVGTTLLPIAGVAAGFMALGEALGTWKAVGFDMKEDRRRLQSAKINKTFFKANEKKLPDTPTDRAIKKGIENRYQQQKSYNKWSLCGNALMSSARVLTFGGGVGMVGILIASGTLAPILSPVGIVICVGMGMHLAGSAIKLKIDHAKYKRIANNREMRKLAYNDDNLVPVDEFTQKFSNSKDEQKYLKLIEKDPLSLAMILKAKMIEERKTGETKWTNYILDQLNASHPADDKITAFKLLNSKGDHILINHFCSP